MQDLRNLLFNHIQQLPLKDFIYVFQPGTFDQPNTLNNDIGTLADFITISFDPEITNSVDAAIAISTIDMIDNATPADGYGTPKSQTVIPRIKQHVLKYGRSTGLTKGKITFINGTINVNYGTDDYGHPLIAKFEGQIGIEPINAKRPFSDGGDSGALVVTQKNNPVGLLFAGNVNGTTAFANPIQDVLDMLNVDIDGD